MKKPATIARLTDTDKIRNEDGSFTIALTVPARLAAFAEHELKESDWGLHDLALGALSWTLGVPLEEGRNLMSADEIATFQRGQKILARTNERLLGGKIVTGLRRGTLSESSDQRGEGAGDKASASGAHGQVSPMA